ncbi:hypothetical protein F5Y08DRAFT_337156 [Xylaria arbuscula]|nr:hypothetical protein F5Y08DRAFT_337156 [Xylaria arbuscula]
MSVSASPTYPLRLSLLEGLMPNTYVRQILCFPTIDAQAIISLARGLSGLARDVPYVLSRLISNETENAGSKLAVSAPCHRVEDVFSWHDLSASIDYAALRAGHFAPASFPVPDIVPLGTLPPYPDSPAVFLARASLVNGGLILSVAVHHLVTDITGFDALLKIWASRCRGGDIGFDTSWIDRTPLFSDLESLPDTASGTISMPDLLHSRAKVDTVRSSGRSEITESGKKHYRTGIFYFPRQHLQALKDAANVHVASQEPGSWVSTSDVLAALLWSAIIRTQEHSSISDESSTHKHTRVSTLSFPVQFRSALRPQLPRNFLGAAFLMTSARVPHEEVCRISGHRNDGSSAQAQDEGLRLDALGDDGEMESPLNCVHVSALANVALAIRRSVRGIDDVAVRGVLAYLQAHPRSNPDATLVLGPPRCEPGGSSTSVVSWADQSVYELDWGAAIGRCDTMRLTKMAGKRDPIVLPHIPSRDGGSGGLEVIMSYEEDFMQRLLENAAIKRLATLRCLS